MIVSHRHRFVFIHIHKTAGEAVTATLAPDLGREDLVMRSQFDVWRKAVIHPSYRQLNGLTKHTTAAKAREVLPDDVWASYFTFAIVRDPLARMMSLYRYLADVIERRERRRVRHIWYRTAAGRRADPDRWRVTRAFRETADFSEFIRHPATARSTMLRSQVSFLGDGSGRLLVDFVGRFESLDADVASIVERIGLPPRPIRRVNVSPRTLAVEVQPADRDYVRTRYADDYRVFGYR